MKRIREIEFIRSVFGRQHPCPHENARTDLGNGKIWARCEDCGLEFHQENWDMFRESSKEYDKALDILGDLEKELLKHRGLS